MKSTSGLPHAIVALAAVYGSLLLPGKTLEVGKGKQFSTIAAAAAQVSPGDTVLIHPGTYNEGVFWRGGKYDGPPIVVRGVPGVPRPIIDGRGVTLAGAGRYPRALFQIEGDNYIFENLVLQNARNGRNAAGIRVLKARKTAIRNVLIKWNDMGVMSTSNDELLIENSEIAWNGTPQYNGYAHNFYIEGERAVIRSCYIHNATSGQVFKARTRYVELFYNYIADAHDRIEGGDTTKEVGIQQNGKVNPPNSHALLIGNIIVKSGNGGAFLDFGPEGSEPPRNGTLFMVNNTVIRETPVDRWMLRLGHRNDRAVLYNNIFFGFKNFARGDGAENITGSNNWFPADAEPPPGLKYTFRGKDPGFVNLASRDYRLRPDSACVNQGGLGLHTTDADGRDVVSEASEELQPFMKTRSRPKNGRIDIGALEHITLGPAELTGQLRGANGVVLGGWPIVIADASSAFSVRTDPGGKFRIEGISAGEYTVKAWDFRFPLNIAPVKTQVPGSVVIQTPAVYSLKAAIRTLTGRSVSKIPIYLEGDTSGWRITDDSGGVTFGTLPSGGQFSLRTDPQFIALNPPVMETQPLKEDTSLVLSGEGHLRVKGRILTNTGEPLYRVSILISRENGPPLKTGSNARGSFTTPFLPEGANLTITPTMADYRFDPPQIVIRNLSADQRPLEFTAVRQ